MKHPVIAIFSWLCLSIGLLSAQQAPILSKKLPPPTKVTVIKDCGAKKIWVPGHWVWKKSQQAYRWKHGNCLPARKGYLYVQGYWLRIEGGWTWEMGKWQKIKHFASS